MISGKMFFRDAATYFTTPRVCRQRRKKLGSYKISKSLRLQVHLVDLFSGNI